ncbi:MAG: cysteine desulfurase family protein [Anaerorhabdus sp.]
MQKVQLPRLYLDSASTTAIHPEVLDGYCRLLGTEYYNTDALYDEATNLSRMMEKSRASIAEMLQVHPDEVLFTSGATESNNLAIKGVAFQYPEKKHIITTQIEHSSVLNAVKQLEKDFGYEVTYLAANSEGVISIEELKHAVRQDTAIISIMMVNNEIGSIQPINEIKEWIKKNTSAFFHVDAVQAIGKVDVDIRHIDLVSLSAHKIEGLKGSGVLIKKRHVKLSPLLNGGQQEYGIRGGTSNSLVNIFFAKTLRLALENKEKYAKQIREIRQYLNDELLKIDGIVLNSPINGVSHIVNFSCFAIPSEVMMNALNQKGIAVAAQSTCSSQEKGSRVLRSIGLEDRASTCIRISFSHHITKEDVARFIENLKEICKTYGNL